MSLTSADIRRIAHRKQFIPTDIRKLAPNLLLLEPLVVDKTKAGILMPGENAHWEHLCFRVLAKGETRHRQERLLPVAIGDIVVIRNALSEAIDPTRQLLVVDAIYVVALVATAEEMAREAEAEAERERVAGEEIAAARKGLRQ